MPVTTPTQTITDTGFTGQHHNNPLGLIYYNARYYDPALSRFISPDTLIPDPSNSQSFNRYAYTRNNPVNRTDPTGHVDCNRLGQSFDDDVVACNFFSSHSTAKSPPKPTISDADPFDVSTFDPTDAYQAAVMTAIQEAVLLVGQALANALNQIYPKWQLTATEAFLLVYGGTVTFIWQGAALGDYAAETQGANEIWVYDSENTVGRVTNKVQWIIHELGHAFSYAIGGTTVTDAAQAFFDSNPGVGRQADGNYTGYFDDEDDNGSLLWQQSHRLLASEQFADMFIGWVYGQWQAGPYRDGLSFGGYQMSNFMNGNIPTWLNLIVQQ